MIHGERWADEEDFFTHLKHDHYTLLDSSSVTHKRKELYAIITLSSYHLVVYLTPQMYILFINCISIIKQKFF